MKSEWRVMRLSTVTNGTEVVLWQIFRLKDQTEGFVPGNVIFVNEVSKKTKEDAEFIAELLNEDERHISEMVSRMIEKEANT